MSDQGTFLFATEEPAAGDVIVDQQPDRYGFYFARPVKLGTRAPIVTGCGARTPTEAARMLRTMLAVQDDLDV